MELPTYFTDFLSEIRLTDAQIENCHTGHTTLRKRLESDEKLAPFIVSTFIQGSYRRATAVRPLGDKRADVDVVVVTRLSKEKYPNPSHVYKLFMPFLDTYYVDERTKQKKYLVQGRSIGIELSYVDMDLVITSAPSEVDEGILESESVRAQSNLLEAADWRLTKSWIPLEMRAGGRGGERSKSASQEAEWKLAPLYIPDREAKCWRPTHPIEQLRWTRDKNLRCNGHYVNFVKALKWWRLLNDRMPEHPKGYPLEHLVGQNCPDGIESVAQGIVLTLENMARNYQTHVALGTKPTLPDHGVPEHDVLMRITEKEFAAFHKQATAAAKIARRALDIDTPQASAKAWQELFGDKFPDAPPDSGRGSGPNFGPKKGYTPRTEPSVVGEGRFA